MLGGEHLQWRTRFAGECRFGQLNGRDNGAFSLLSPRNDTVSNVTSQTAGNSVLPSTAATDQGVYAHLGASLEVAN